MEIVRKMVLGSQFRSTNQLVMYKLYVLAFKMWPYYKHFPIQMNTHFGQWNRT